MAAWIIIVSVLGGLLLFGLAGFALYRVSAILLPIPLPSPTGNWVTVLTFVNVRF